MGSLSVASSPPQGIFEIFSLHGKTAIVTGGTGGIGVELCLALAQAGADIVSIQMPNDPQGPALSQLIRGLKRNITAFECNVAEPKSIREAFVAMWEAGVVPDILLNCAGINRRGKFEDISDDNMTAVLNVNLRGAYVVSQEFGKRLLSVNRPGKIIHISSMAAYIAMSNVSIYACSKAGVLQMTKAISNEWAGRGIQCNCICPGWIKTQLTQPLWGDLEFYDMSIGRTPAGRWGLPKDLQGAVLFLASQASNFVTGTSIVVDGGVLAK